MQLTNLTNIFEFPFLEKYIYRIPVFYEKTKIGLFKFIR